RTLLTLTRPPPPSLLADAPAPGDAPPSLHDALPIWRGAPPTRPGTRLTETAPIPATRSGPRPSETGPIPTARPGRAGPTPSPRRGGAGAAAAFAPVGPNPGAVPRVRRPDRRAAPAEELERGWHDRPGASPGGGRGVVDAYDDVDDEAASAPPRGAARRQARPAGPEPRPELPHVDGLDGVRAVALLAVMAFHHGFGFARGGFLAISTFFTLSGFLVTTLALAEWSQSGRLALARFWQHRVRRIAPA